MDEQQEQRRIVVPGEVPAGDLHQAKPNAQAAGIPVQVVADAHDEAGVLAVYRLSGALAGKVAIPRGALLILIPPEAADQMRAARLLARAKPTLSGRHGG